MSALLPAEKEQKMRKFILPCVLALITPVPAGAQEGSNIALTEYPGPTCIKPQQPVPPGKSPGTLASGTEMRNYMLRLEAFNKQIAVVNEKMAVFNDCLKTYVDNGNADMRRIKQRLDAAIAAANAP